MDWRESLIAQHEKQIANLQQGVDWMKEGKFATFEVSAGGQKTYTTAQQIETYERMIAELKNLVGKLKDGEI